MSLPMRQVQFLAHQVARDTGLDTRDQQTVVKRIVAAVKKGEITTRTEMYARALDESKALHEDRSDRSSSC